VKTICLKSIASGGYIRVAEDCTTWRNLGLIQVHGIGATLWVKKAPSNSGAKLYSGTGSRLFTQHKSSPNSTPCGGTGYLGGRKFGSMKIMESYLSGFGKVVRCSGAKKRR